MNSLEDKMSLLAYDYRRRARDLRATDLEPYHPENYTEMEIDLVAGIWEAAARGIDETIKNHNRWHQEPT